VSNNSTASNIPQPGAPFLVGRPEPISPVWWAFLLSMFQRTGGAGTPPVAITLDDVFALETVFGVQSTEIEVDRSMVMAPIQDSSYLPEMVFAPPVETSFAQMPSTVTVGASPFTYLATSRQAVHVVGGTVSGASYARGTTSLPLAIAAGGQILEMNAGDALTITYTVAPTITVIPR
jgi:hypothetical protein